MSCLYVNICSNVSADHWKVGILDLIEVILSMSLFAGLAEAGLIPSNLSHTDGGFEDRTTESESEGAYFRPDRYVYCSLTASVSPLEVTMKLKHALKVLTSINLTTNFDLT